MNTTYWINHFTQNAEITRSIILTDEPCSLPESIRIPLARSIAIFQLGESGGGTRLRAYAQKIAPLQNFQGYLDAMDLFIAEEQGHARLLAKLLGHLGGTPLQKQWTNSIFRSLRVLVNVEFNIQVLLTAELIAEVYFGNLFLRVPDVAVKQVARKLLADEMKHLVFQRQFLSERLKSLPTPLRLLWHWQFICVHRITTWVVSWDHADCLRAIGLTPRCFRSRAEMAISHFSKQLWQSVKLMDPSETAPKFLSGRISKLG
jgi:hypothetical protein